jgi:hypothetical protein
MRVRCAPAIAAVSRRFELDAGWVPAYSQLSCTLELLADGTQELNFNIDNNFVLTYPGLSDDFHVVRLEFDTTNQLFAATIGGRVQFYRLVQSN